ncbi:autophagy protein atg9 [Pestalotiopsis sp. IQ-011]
MSSLKGPSSKFGPVVAVLGQHAPPTDTNSATGLVGSGGTDSWSKAFLAMVEGILRDGEDLAVTISYSLIRHHVKRLGHLLGAVTQSRLVILDACCDTNVLVHRRTRSETRSGTTHDTRTSTTRRAPAHVDTSEEDSSRSRHWETLVGRTTSAADTDQDPHVGLSVSGLRDWSNCIFGDPLMAEVFNDDPPADFIRGFRQQPPRGKTTAPTTSSPSSHTSRASSPPPDDLIEDRENASSRLLLYECYHATHAVVKQFHRPAGTDGTRREMEARRRLAAVLNRLAEVDDNVAKRPRSGSLDDMWPMKKSKVES